MSAYADVCRYWGFERGKASTRLWGLVAFSALAVGALLGVPVLLVIILGLIAATVATYVAAAAVERRRRRVW